MKSACRLTHWDNVAVFLAGLLYEIWKEIVLADRLHTAAHTRYINAADVREKVVLLFWQLYTFLFSSDQTGNKGQGFVCFFTEGCSTFAFQFSTSIFFFKKMFVPEDGTETPSLAPSRERGWTGRNSSWQVGFFFCFLFFLENKTWRTLCHLAPKHWKQTKLWFDFLTFSEPVYAVPSTEDESKL